MVKSYNKLANSDQGGTHPMKMVRSPFCVILLLFTIILYHYYDSYLVQYMSGKEKPSLHLNLKTSTKYLAIVKIELKRERNFITYTRNIRIIHFPKMEVLWLIKRLSPNYLFLCHITVPLFYFNCSHESVGSFSILRKCF